MIFKNTAHCYFQVFCCTETLVISSIDEIKRRRYRAMSCACLWSSDAYFCLNYHFSKDVYLNDISNIAWCWHSRLLQALLSPLRLWDMVSGMSGCRALTCAVNISDTNASWWNVHHKIAKEINLGTSVEHCLPSHAWLGTQNYDQLFPYLHSLIRFFSPNVRWLTEQWEEFSTVSRQSVTRLRR